MICSRCTGKHHSMSCPLVRKTLLQLGIDPTPPAVPPRSDIREVEEVLSRR